MKKSTLLSLLTATSITLTTAGTYAAWDSLEASTKENQVTFRNPVTVTISEDLTLTDPNKLGDPSVSGDVSFTISNNTNNDTNLGDTLTIVPNITSEEGSGATVNDFNIVIKDTGDSNKTLSQSGSGFVDKSLDSTNYTVTVTPKESSKDQIEGKKFNIELTATLSKSN